VASKAGDRILRSIFFTDGSAAVVVLGTIMSPVVLGSIMSPVVLGSGVRDGVVSGIGVAFRGNASCPPWSSTIDVDISGVADVEQP